MNACKPLRGEVWLAEFDQSIGHEQAKKRPCIVVSANMFNQSYSGLVIVVPLTKRNRNNPLHITLMPPDGGIVVQSYALCEQIRAISVERLSKTRIGKVSEQIMKALEFTLKIVLDFD